MILKIKELWIFVVFHSPNSGHGDERPPKAFPGAIDKRTRKFIWVFETVLSGESVWCLGNSHYFSPGGGGRVGKGRYLGTKWYFKGIREDQSSPTEYNWGTIESWQTMNYQSPPLFMSLELSENFDKLMFWPRITCLQSTLKGILVTRNTYRSIDLVLETNFNLQIFSLLPKKKWYSVLACSFRWWIFIISWIFIPVYSHIMIKEPRDTQLFLPPSKEYKAWWKSSSTAGSKNETCKF